MGSMQKGKARVQGLGRGEGGNGTMKEYWEQTDQIIQKLPIL